MSLDCTLDLDPVACLAMQQNAVPLVRQVLVRNSGEAAYHDLTVTLRAEPDFAEPWRHVISHLGPRAEYVVPLVDLVLSPGFLGGLRERQAGRLHLSVTAGAAGREVLFERSYPVDLLAYDQWGGLEPMPDLLAAFVLPNHPAVEELLRRASVLLAQWTGDGSLSGYQSGDPRRVFATVAAIYSAVAEQRIQYASPPASFETAGQKIRTPDRVLEYRLGTCLDLALLLAACLEQSGLHPLIALLPGHALVGCWLLPSSFSERSRVDMQALRKRVDLHEIVVFEPTAVTASPPRDFERARADAAPRLRDDGALQALIDVARARQTRVRPLPIRAEGVVLAATPADELMAACATLEAAPVIPDLHSGTIGMTNATGTRAAGATAGSATDVRPSAAGSAVVGAAGVGATAAGATAAGATAAGATAAGATAAGTTAAGLTAAGSTAAGTTTASSTAASSTAGDSTGASSKGAGSTAVGASAAAPTAAGSSTAHSTDAPPPPVEDATTRLDRWKRKLLDLTLRNRLLNHKDSKRSVPILCPDLPALENLLAEECTFEVLGQPPVFAAGDPRSAALSRERTGEDVLGDYLREGMAKGRLHADLSQDEVDRRLLEIFRHARTSQEEGGVSTLYMVFGFLAWREADTSARQLRAPLLLVPIEVTRRSVQSGFRLRLQDDDALVNTTLLTKLETDFGLRVEGLDPLPEDESGVDVHRVFQIFRQATKDLPGWEVKEEAGVGFYSFTKHLMWHDLEARLDTLTDNQVVDHLVHHPHEFFAGDFTPVPLDELDDARPLTEIFCTLDADSSQLAAVLAASDGHSFVLEGPPGTGKSQTISNVISQCLAEGRTVLFVSEKMAALEVVKRRLDGIGLGPFCLELHSSKARKSDVLKQFEAALQTAGAQSPADWQRQAEQLQALRADLNRYVRALHRRQPCGWTAFHGISRLIESREVAHVPLAWKASGDIDEPRRLALEDAVERMQATAAGAGEVAGHALGVVRLTEWTPRRGEEAAAATEKLIHAIDRLHAPLQQWAQRVGFGEARASATELELLDAVAGLFVQSPGAPAALLTEIDGLALDDAIATWIRTGRERDELRARVHERYLAEVTALDLDDLQARWRRAETSGWLMAWWRRRPVRRALRTVVREGARLVRDEIAGDLGAARELRAREGALAAASDHARRMLGKLWRDGEADWDHLAATAQWAARLRQVALRAAGGDVQGAALLRERWARLLAEGAELLARGGPVSREIGGFQQAAHAWREARRAVVRLLDVDEACAWGAADEPDLLARARTLADGWRGALPRLRDWCAWRGSRDTAVGLGLLPLVEQLEQGAITATQLPAVFRHSFLRWWVGALFDEQNELRSFSTGDHERKIARFRELDRRYTELTAQVVRARLASRVPRAATASTALGSSEVGILARELQKKRRHLPVRKLLQTIPRLLPQLKPCLLMSPLSVAQFLDPTHPPFDLVVFDEASQIPVWDAVGAIARGRRAVVVGDTKQLPPTSFFLRQDAEDEPVDESQVEDLESILDDCMAASMPRLRLDWHYRSRHESLITFSNHHYYDNRLLTFPSAGANDGGVRLVPVPDGVYDRSRSRTNRREAEEVVAEILRRLTDPDAGRRDRSLGVVTFSQSQQVLIEDLLDQARRERPEIERYFSPEIVREPVFVKNLENVQGDERDVILFSICYGPDAAGKVAMHFGPLNNDGGHRRLNVAVTRAREEVLVFSTLRAEQIDLSRTGARGVQDLKNFLDYAARGQRAIIEAVRHEPGGVTESPFEEQVYRQLVERGWTVHPQVGCSGYRVDLGVVDPRMPGRYLLGIECDGANYHSGKTARDRDRLRAAVLAGLGWTLHRIWSTDWWLDPHGQMAKLESVLAARLAADPGSELVVKAGGEAGVEDGGDTGEEHGPGPAAEVEPQAGSGAGIGPSWIAHAAVIGESPAPGESYGSEPALRRTFEAAEVRARPYVVCQLPAVVGGRDVFLAPESTQVIERQILEVIAAEAPISLDVLIQRVSSAWGFGRSKRTQARIEALLPLLNITETRRGETRFLWSVGTPPSALDTYRVPGPEADSRRNIADVPPEEAAQALIAVIEDNVSLSEDDLVREAARRLGFGRTSAGIAARMGEALDYLIEQGGARRDGGMVTR